MSFRSLVSLRSGPIVAVVIGLMLASCASSADPASSTTTTTIGDIPSTSAPPAPQPDPDPGVDAPILYWNDSSKSTDLGNGWTATTCSGDAPLLCVSKDGEPVGSLEAIAFPIESFEGLEPGGDPETNLELFAAGFLEAMTTDRVAGCGADYVIEPIDPEPMVIGNTPGLAFGYTGTLPDGSPSEHNLQYATIVEDMIVSIVAIAYDDEGCPGRDDLSGFRSPDLIAFRPYLESALPESALPDLES